jgi:hypothetical protein
MFDKILSENSDLSVMRLMCLLSLISGIAIAILGICLNKDLSATAVLSSVFVGAAFAGKATQKFAEVKEIIKDK